MLLKKGIQFKVYSTQQQHFHEQRLDWRAAAAVRKRDEHTRTYTLKQQLRLVFRNIIWYNSFKYTYV